MRSPSVSFVTALAVSLLTAVPLAAQEAKPLSLSAAAISAAATGSLADVTAAPADDRYVVREHRPGALVPLYVSFSALQVLDMHSTAGALGRGAVQSGRPAVCRQPVRHGCREGRGDRRGHPGERAAVEEEQGGRRRVHAHE